MKNKTPAFQSEIHPWPGSVFALKIKWIKSYRCRLLRTFLERRATGKFGRLEIMRVAVPSRKRLDETERIFASAKYRKGMLARAAEIIRQAGVPQKQAERFMKAILKEYPAPTEEDALLDMFNNPAVKLMLGKNRQEFSYFKTGIPAITKDDMQVVKKCMDEFKSGLMSDPKKLKRFTDTFFGRPVAPDDVDKRATLIENITCHHQASSQSGEEKQSRHPAGTHERPQSSR